ncbi:MAG: hypothetical protein ACOY3K_07270 [Candidatus Omnitrophota bacterium]
MKIKYGRWLGAFFLGGAIFYSGCAGGGASGGLWREADVALKVQPILIRVVVPGITVDAVPLSAGNEPMRYAVLFAIERVTKGEFTQERSGGPSKFDQAAEALSKRQILKILTMDFSDPAKLVEKGWISVAVHDPEKTFGLKITEEEPEGRYTLYLKRTPEQENSFFLLGARRG